MNQLLDFLETYQSAIVEAELFETDAYGGLLCCGEEAHFPAFRVDETLLVKREGSVQGLYLCYFVSFTAHFPFFCSIANCS